MEGLGSRVKRMATLCDESLSITASKVTGHAPHPRKIHLTAQPGTRGNVVLALPRRTGARGFGRDLFHTLPRTSP